MLGNWDKVETNPSGTGTFESQTWGDDEPRTHNFANELEDRDPDGTGGNDPLDLTYDDAGNLRLRDVDADDALRYTHDAWNRLVNVEYVADIGDPGESAQVRAAYTYNGLNWRIIKQADRDHTDQNHEPDEQRYMYYSANWQLLEEDVWDDWDDQTPGSVDRHVMYVWGQRYIDDIVLRREDRNTDGDYEDAGDITRYYLTDVQFSPVVILEDSNAAVIERPHYTPYGCAEYHYGTDLNGDGDADNDDQSILFGNWGNFGRGDLDRTGSVDIDDFYVLMSVWGHDVEAGQITEYVDASGVSEDNQIGYCGYIFNPETHDYTVRFRYYSPELGRWLEKDPIGYDDGNNSYQRVRSSPIRRIDSLGRESEDTEDDSPSTEEPDYFNPAHWETSPCKRDLEFRRGWKTSDEGCKKICDKEIAGRDKEKRRVIQGTDRDPKGLLPGDFYGVSLCENGKRTTCCVCIKGYQRRFQSYPPQAFNVLAACTRVHEETHMKQECDPDASCHECEAYRAELKCLEAAPAECAKFKSRSVRKRCEQAVMAKKRDVEEQLPGLCEGCPKEKECE